MMRIKPPMRFLIFLIISAILFSVTESAFAYIPCMCNNPADQCTCFIQLGDKGLPVKLIIEKLREKGYLGKIEKNNEFTLEVKQAVIHFQTDHGLNLTGCMDDETLDTLLFGVLPDASEKQSRDYWDTICYVPTDGGQKYHDNPRCSGMYYPRMISRVNAVCLGLEACKKDSCTKCSVLTYTSLGLEPRVLPDEYYEDNSELILTTDATDNIVAERLLPTNNQENYYIGNKNSHVFHLASCKSVKDMKEKNKVEFLTRDEAIEKGYRPCDRCKP